MDAAVALLVFLVAAMATVVISLAVQQRSHLRSTRRVADPHQLDELGERCPSEEAGWNQTVGDGRSDRSGAERQEERRRARAEQLEAVADRERRYAERAEAEARRLREEGEEGEDELGPMPNEQRARRAGIATDDLDY